MRVCVISDIHANLEALEALPREYDELWVLGDIVNYGPNPAEAVEWVRQHASTAVRGNHDHAVAFGEDCRCSPRFREMAEATCRYTTAVLSEGQKRFLQGLPMQEKRQIDGREFFLCHATPSDLLYEYRPLDSPLWAREEEVAANADVILAGHTHQQFARAFGARLVANPGSLGQSKSGDSRARYAVWQDDHLELKASEYLVETTVDKILSLPVPDKVKRDLIQVLRTGTNP